MDATSLASCDYLLMWPTSLALCIKKHIAQMVCKVIDAVDSGKHMDLWYVRRVEASLNYLRY